MHGVDTLGARLGSFDRLEKALPDGERWSGYDRGLGGGAYFGAPAGDDVAPEAAVAEVTATPADAAAVLGAADGPSRNRAA